MTQLEIKRLKSTERKNYKSIFLRKSLLTSSRHLEFVLNSLYQKLNYLIYHITHV